MTRVRKQSAHSRGDSSQRAWSWVDVCIAHRVEKTRINERDSPSAIRRQSMKIALASDHAGFTLKDEIKRLLQGEGHTIEDFGATSEAAVDLADHVYPAALAVGEGRVDRGIFVDGVGYGSAMIANKIAGVYAAVCQDPFCATLARSHSDTNVLCIGGKIIGSALAIEIVRTWMTTEFLGGEEKYKRRVEKVKEIAKKHLKPSSA
jgi:ribose 5-phosphate isomerase B